MNDNQFDALMAQLKTISAALQRGPKARTTKGEERAEADAKAVDNRRETEAKAADKRRDDLHAYIRERVLIDGKSIEFVADQCDLSVAEVADILKAHTATRHGVFA